MPSSPPYDPVADASGSSDPLGTMGGSERLAEVLLPGLTARMWRARLLTFAVVAADIADEVVRRSSDQEDLRLKAKLAFERLFVSGLVRREADVPERYSGSSRRLPGQRIARQVLRFTDEPLTRQNFIKGQAVNGQSGVMSRLARHLELLGDDGQVAGRGFDLRSEWARSAAAAAAAAADDTDQAGSAAAGKFHKKILDSVTALSENSHTTQTSRIDLASIHWYLLWNRAIHGVFPRVA
ncbi:MAG TPA: hypothetical protein VMV69_27255 [Pirellulales bacterium]|nr:hypothetical protein [Pirellulales bacterium]